MYKRSSGFNNRGRPRNGYGHSNGQGYQRNQGGNQGYQRNQGRRNETPHWVIPSIDLSINSFQVGNLCQRLWRKQNLKTIADMCKFFIDLRKSIIKQKVETEITLDTEIAKLIENEPFVEATKATEPWFATEQTSSSDSQRRFYDCEIWSKFFVMMLPPVDIMIPRTVECFKLLCEISQQISESEIAAHRKAYQEEADADIEKKVKKLNRLLADGEITREGYEKEKSDFEYRKNQEVIAKQTKKRKEIWATYDMMKNSVDDVKVQDDDNLQIIFYWRFLTRNPCFPLPYLKFGKTTIPAQQFSLLNAFQYKMEDFINNFVMLRTFYYSQHPTLNAKSPKQNEINDWLEIYLPLATSEQLSSFVENPISISTLKMFDENYYEFCFACSEAVSIKPVIQSVDETSAANILTRESYPYQCIGLRDEVCEEDVVHIINVMNKNTSYRYTLLLKAYNPNVVKECMARFLTSGKIYSHLICTVAQNLGLELFDIFNLVRMKTNQLGYKNDALYSLAVIILLIWENCKNHTSEGFIENCGTLIEGIFDDNKMNIADIIVFLTSFKEIFEESGPLFPYSQLDNDLKAFIVSKVNEASAILSSMSKTNNTGFLRYQLKDVLDFFDPST